jgi:hypothetical protein
VHLIIAFHPHDESENRQLEGRTCRQDDPGSSQKIIWMEDLKHLGSDKPDFKPALDQNWDQFLAETRDEYLRLKYEKIQIKKAEYVEKHKLTMEACDKMQKIGGVDFPEWPDLARMFGKATALPLSDQPATNSTSAKGHHVVFVLDDSTSMVCAIFLDMMWCSDVFDLRLCVRVF